MRRLTDDEFLAKARLKHGDRYEILDPYTNARTHIRVRCKKHNHVFTVKPGDFLFGNGCPICGNERKGRRTPPNEIISMAEQVHGIGRYDYSQVGDFANIGERVPIICHQIGVDGKEHGAFLQTFRNHIYNHQGCPKCHLDSLRKPVFGVGINDMINMTRSDAYLTWARMLGRCYNENNPSHNRYIDCEVAKEWHTFSNFYEWFKDPSNGYKKGYCLDKDILFKGNRIYSPERCSFVPSEINCMFQDTSSTRGKYPIGVRKSKGRYAARCCFYDKHTHLGYYKTPEEAFNAYKTAKESYIKEVAATFYNDGKITKRVYDAMVQYIVEITD